MPPGPGAPLIACKSADSLPKLAGRSVHPPTLLSADSCPAVPYLFPCSPRPLSSRSSSLAVPLLESPLSPVWLPRWPTLAPAPHEQAVSRSRECAVSGLRPVQSLPFRLDVSCLFLLLLHGPTSPMAHTPVCAVLTLMSHACLAWNTPYHDFRTPTYRNYASRTSRTSPGSLDATWFTPRQAGTAMEKGMFVQSQGRECNGG